MKRSIFLYKLLLAIKNRNVTELDGNLLYDNYDILNDVLYTYGLYEFMFNSNEEYITELLFVFTDFEMGIYTNDHKLIFNEQPSIEEIIYKFNLDNISDKLINEIAMIVLFSLKEKESKKQLV